MIRPVCVIVLILSFNFSFGQSNIDVLHYKFNLLLKDQNDTIVGIAGIKLKFLRPSDSFQINLAAQNSDGKGMKVDMIITSLMDSLRFRQQNDEVDIILKKRSKINDSITCLIFYHGIPSDGLIISKNKYGERTFFADNWPDRAHNWIPCVDNPADKASFEFIVTAPS